MRAATVRPEQRLRPRRDGGVLRPAEPPSRTKPFDAADAGQERAPAQSAGGELSLEAQRVRRSRCSMFTGYLPGWYLPGFGICVGANSKSHLVVREESARLMDQAGSSRTTIEQEIARASGAVAQDNHRGRAPHSPAGDSSIKERRGVLIPRLGGKVQSPLSPQPRRSSAHRK